MSRSPKEYSSIVPSLFLGLIIFFAPSNWFLKFGESQAYVSGLLSDYLLVKLYFTDFLIWGFIAWSLIFHWQSLLSFIKRFPILTVISAVFLVLVQLLSPKPAASLWFASQLITMLLLGWSIVNHKKLNVIVLVMAVVSTIIFQAVLGGYQFITQQSIAGYVFFG